LGVAFFGVAAFFAAAVFFGAAFLVAFGAAGAVVLVTRPDFVLPRTRWTSSSTAGAGAAALRVLLALALGFAATAAFLGKAALEVDALMAAAFLGAAAFLVVVALAFYVGCQRVQFDDAGVRRTVAVAVAFLGEAAFFTVVFFSAALGSTFFAAVGEAGLASFLASFTVPEAPVRRVSNAYIEWTESRLYEKT